MTVKAMLTPGIDTKARIPYHSTPPTRLEHVTIEALRGAGVPSAHLPRDAHHGLKPALGSSLKLSAFAASCLLDDTDEDGVFDPRAPYRGPQPLRHSPRGGAVGGGVGIGPSPPPPLDGLELGGQPREERGAEHQIREAGGSAPPLRRGPRRAVRGPGASVPGDQPIATASVHTHDQALGSQDHPLAMPSANAHGDAMESGQAAMGPSAHAHDHAEGPGRATSRPTTPDREGGDLAPEELIGPAAARPPRWSPASTQWG